jgi:hypothetical protein
VLFPNGGAKTGSGGAAPTHAHPWLRHYEVHVIDASDRQMARSIEKWMAVEIVHDLVDVFVLVYTKLVDLEDRMDCM